MLDEVEISHFRKWTSSGPKAETMEISMSMFDLRCHQYLNRTSRLSSLWRPLGVWAELLAIVAKILPDMLEEWWKIPSMDVILHIWTTRKSQTQYSYHPIVFLYSYKFYLKKPEPIFRSPYSIQYILPIFNDSAADKWALFNANILFCLYLCTTKK